MTDLWMNTNQGTFWTNCPKSEQDRATKVILNSDVAAPSTKKLHHPPTIWIPSIALVVSQQLHTVSTYWGLFLLMIFVVSFGGCVLFRQNYSTGEHCNPPSQQTSAIVNGCWSRWGECRQTDCTFVCTFGSMGSKSWSSTLSFFFSFCWVNWTGSFGVGMCGILHWLLQSLSSIQDELIVDTEIVVFSLLLYFPCANMWVFVGWYSDWHHMITTYYQVAPLPLTTVFKWLEYSIHEFTPVFEMYVITVFVFRMQINEDEKGPLTSCWCKNTHAQQMLWVMPWAECCGFSSEWQ